MRGNHFKTPAVDTQYAFGIQFSHKYFDIERQRKRYSFEGEGASFIPRDSSHVSNEDACLHLHYLQTTLDMSLPEQLLTYSFTRISCGK
jgi:hypothetical protein